MGFFNWHQQQVRKISEKNMGRALLGGSLAVISLGSLFSRTLVRSGLSFLIFIAATLTAAHYIIGSYNAWHKGRTQGYQHVFIGTTAGFLLLLFFGVQTTQLPLKGPILVLGLLLTLPALGDLIKGGPENPY